MKAAVIGFDVEEIRSTVASATTHWSGFTYDPIVPVAVDTVERIFRFNGLQWNCPIVGTVTIAGLRCHAYTGRDVRRRQSCFLSHWGAWHASVVTGEPILVLESDAIFTRDFDESELDDCRYGMVSLNDPRGATRKASDYHNAIQYDACDEKRRQFVEVPWIDDRTVPQGLPGHSAYVIQPWFAKELIEGARKYGAMPNDALANRQWFPGKLGCLTWYATKTSGRPSMLR